MFKKYGLGEVSGNTGTEILAAPAINFTNLTQSLIFGSVVNNTVFYLFFILILF